MSEYVVIHEIALMNCLFVEILLNQITYSLNFSPVPNNTRISACNMLKQTHYLEKLSHRWFIM